MDVPMVVKPEPRIATLAQAKPTEADAVPAVPTSAPTGTPPITKKRWLDTFFISRRVAGQPTKSNGRQKTEEKETEASKKGKGLSLNISFGGAPHISIQERINFARHLSVAIHSGLPLIEGLRLIQAQLPSKRLVKVVAEVIRGVNNGQTLAQALGKYQKSFGEFFISMVKVGEASGNLSQNLLHLSKELKKQHDIRGRAKSAMIYPAIVLVATLGMSIGLTVFIFPKILPIFTSLHVALPFTTRLLIAFMEFIQTKGYLAGGVLVVAIIALRGAISFRKIHFYFDRLILLLPVVSKIVVNITLANFSRSLAILLGSGMTLVDSLAVTRVTFHNLYYQREVERIIEAVRRGEEMATHMSQKPHLFPPILTGMIKVGESTGNLEENLRYLAEYFTEEVETSVQNLTSLLEPILVLVMGLVVGFIALSIIMPIYSITQGLNVK